MADSNMNKVSYSGWSYKDSEFCNPPAILWPGPFWMLNGPLKEQTIRHQLREMAAHGARSVCIFPIPPETAPDAYPTDFSPAYLSKGYFDIIRIMLDQAEQLGMNFWLYDEGGWPSGGACGQVYNTDPEKFCLKRLIYNEETKEVVVQKDNTSGNLGSEVQYINILNPDAVTTFIELTHERYKKHIGEYFGKTIHFTFTDEPGTAFCRPGQQLPWTDDMAEVFLDRKGYELKPFLADLVSKAPTDNESPQLTKARVDFYDVLSKLIVERYLQPIRAWCSKNGLLSSGHFRGDSAPEGNASQNYGHILRAMRGLDIPGVDAIWRQSFPMSEIGPDGQKPVLREGINPHFPKYASSVARQAGQPLVMSELYGVYGHGLTPAQMKFITDQHFVYGVSQVVAGVYPYNNTDHRVAAFPPHLCPDNSLWPYLDIYNRYTARLSYLLTRGQAICHTAVYYDIRSIWAGASTQDRAIELHHAIAEALLDAQCDFDYVDDDAITAAEIQEDSLVVGSMQYSTLIVPATQWLEPTAAKVIDRFINAGGRVICVDGSAGFEGGNVSHLAPEKLTSCSAQEIVECVRPVVKIDPPVKNIRVCKRKTDLGALYFITNEDDCEHTLSIALPEKGPVSIADIDNAAWYALDSNQIGDDTFIKLKLWPWGSAVICCGQPAEKNLCEIPLDTETVCFEKGWRVRPSRAYQITDRVEIQQFSNNLSEPIKLGDWSKVLGQWFSGDAEYSMDFEIDATQTSRPCWLDLGTVRYACEVFVNDVSVGRRIWKPFLFGLAGKLRTGKNQLRIVVTNTMANASLNPKTRHLWDSLKGQTWPKDVLFSEETRLFDAESLPSGLFGPIRLILGG